MHLQTFSFYTNTGKSFSWRNSFPGEKMEVFELKTSERDGIPVLHVEGYFGEEAGNKAREQVLAWLGKSRVDIIVDFSKCNVINSLGISCLFDFTLKVCEDNQGKLFLAGMNQLMKEVVSLSGISSFAIEVSDISSALLKLGKVG